MKQMAILRLKFENRWNLLSDDDRFDEEGSLRRGWISRFESLLQDTFWEVFSEAKRSLEPKPAEFAYNTVRDWCLAAEDTRGRILIDLENRLIDWEDILHQAQLGVASEISATDLVYRPQSALCLDTVASLPPKSRDLRKILSQIHPYLIRAMKNVLAQEGCATLQEAIENYPVLRGLEERELQRFRGSRSMTENTASKELLNARLGRVIGEVTLDRYFRPKQFLPR